MLVQVWLQPEMSLGDLDENNFWAEIYWALLILANSPILFTFVLV